MTILLNLVKSRWDNDANAACIKHNDGVGMTDDIPDVPAMVGQI